jgi:hypothetical protein
MAQEVYFVRYGTYTTSYRDLIYESGLILDRNILYGPISKVIIDGVPTYSFSVNHVSEGTSTYTFDSRLRDNMLLGGQRVLVSDTTVP